MSMRNRLERKSSGDKVVEEVESVDSDADTAESDEKEGGKDKGNTGGQWDARPRMKGDACCSPSDDAPESFEEPAWIRVLPSPHQRPGPAGRTLLRSSARDAFLESPDLPAPGTSTPH